MTLEVADMKILELALSVAVVTVLSGCLASGRFPTEEPVSALAVQTLYVAPVVVEPGVATEPVVALHGELLQRLRRLSKRRKRSHEASFAVVDASKDGVTPLRVTVVAFEPDYDVATALVVGFGTGRPHFEVVVELGALKETLAVATKRVVDHEQGARVALRALLVEAVEEFVDRNVKRFGATGGTEGA